MRQQRATTLLLITLFGASAAVTARGASQRAQDGVYSAEQQRRGERAYRRFCAKCHLSDLSGVDRTAAGDGEVPPALAGPEFLDRWKTSSVGALVLTVKRSMPQDAPGTLTMEMSVDLVSYLLSMNEMPSGAADLPTTTETLETIVIGEPAPQR